MDKQLTVDELIKLLEEIRKNHGNDVKVYHDDGGGFTRTSNVTFDDEGDVIISG